MIEQLNEKLKGKEFSFAELDNIMEAAGFYTVFESGATDDIKQDLSVVYTGTESNECEVIIYFEITIDNEEDEVAENFYLRVSSIEPF